MASLSDKAGRERGRMNTSRSRLTNKEIWYDEYVLNGESDPCFVYGINGDCGSECPEYGVHNECAVEKSEGSGE